MTDILPIASADAIDGAARLLARGEIVGVPTETVYGLAAAAGDPAAVARIFALKSRPRFNPLIVHCIDSAQAFGIGAATPLARRLSALFWPGPLTLVLDRVDEDESVCELARAGLDTVALRVPRHPGFHRLLATFGSPLAAPSANPSGALSPVSAAHVAADFSGRLPLLLDGGTCVHGVESTVLDARGSRPVLLRPGAISADHIQDLARKPAAGPVRSPGAALRHYAPEARLRLQAPAPAADEAYLAFGRQPHCDGPVLNLSPCRDLVEAAANLFSMLRELDGCAQAIAVAPIPDQGLGEAINDRLRRAAVS